MKRPRLYVRQSSVLLFATFFIVVGVPLLSSQTATSTDAHVRRIVSAGRLEMLRWPNFSDYRSILETFYRPTYAPVWIRNGRPTPAALELIEALKKADLEGLDPEDYDASRWGERAKSLPQASSAGNAAFDVALTLCGMRYVSDLRIGRVNPQHFKFGFNIGPKKIDLAEFFRVRLINGNNVGDQIMALEPPFDGYKRTKEALHRYMELEKQYKEPPLPAPAGMLLPGGTYAGAAQLAKLLRVLGDLPQGVTPPPDANKYEEPLITAVQQFQMRHGIGTHGLIDQETLEALNVPFSKRVEQLQLTLERWRWFPYTFSQPPIVVNVPEFRLRAFDVTGKVALSMKVNVGEAYETETPMFESNMQYLVFRPYWDVPPNIQKKELAQEIAKDPGYVGFNHFEVIGANGKVLTDTAASPEVVRQLQAGTARLRQKPGPGNALGLVKFIFPNQHSVYLHDTDLSDDMFSAARRDFSHGCIHVEKPADLSAWVLRKNPGWNMERVKQAMESGPNNTRVNLAIPIPVLLLYATAVVHEDEEVYFYPDIYGLDARLAAVLEKGYPYP